MNVGDLVRLYRAKGNQRDTVLCIVLDVSGNSVKVNVDGRTNWMTTGLLEIVSEKRN